MQIDLSDKELRTIYDSLRFWRRKCEMETEELLRVAEWTDNERAKVLVHQEKTYSNLDDLCTKIHAVRVKTPPVKFTEHEEH